MSGDVRMTEEVVLFLHVRVIGCDNLAVSGWNLPPARPIPMNDNPNPKLDAINQISLAFERNWIEGRCPQIEDGLSAVEVNQRSELLVRLLNLEVQYRTQRGEIPTRAEYVFRFPGQSQALDAVFGAVDRPDTEVVSHQGVASTAHVSSNLPSPPEPETMLDRIGRYRINEVLGESGFGRVFRGYDEDLKPPAAIKLPPKHRVARPEDVEAYLSESQILARLKHPRILPDFDGGRERPAGEYCIIVPADGFVACLHKRCPPYIRGVQGAVTSDDTKRRRSADGGVNHQKGEPDVEPPILDRDRVGGPWRGPSSVGASRPARGR